MRKLFQKIRQKICVNKNKKLFMRIYFYYLQKEDLPAGSAIDYTKNDIEQLKKLF